MIRRSAIPTRRGLSPSAGFTLIELLVTITVIGILAAIALGALSAVGNSAREAQTKALVAKLDHVIQMRYNSYLTRRVPIRTTGMNPDVAAKARLAALRDLIRMEMPERWNDVLVDPVTPIQRPALSLLYKAKYDANNPSTKFGPAECLYMIISTGSADARAQFKQSDTGDADGDGWLEFHDGWGRPIMFLRWAPGFSYGPGFQGASAIQSCECNLNEHHDPFDVQWVDTVAFHLIPLIYSGGADKKYDIELDKNHSFSGDPYASVAGTPTDEDGDGLSHQDNIHNHLIEAR